MTNGDVIRSMTNEQLADFMANESTRIIEPIFCDLGIKIEIINQLVCSLRLAWLNREIEN